MATAERQGDTIVIEAPFREKNIVKQLPGVRWDREINAWVAPLTWASVWQLRGVFERYSLEIEDNLVAWVHEEYTRRIEPVLALRDQPDTDIEGLNEAWERLYPFQRVGAKFLALAGSALLADEMGLGKTVQTIVAVSQVGATPILVVCPNSMKRTWANEFEAWAPHLRVVVAQSGAATRRKAINAVFENSADVLIINWEALRSHTRIAGFGSIALTDKEKEPKELNEIQWAAVIADEAHRGKNPQAKQTRALWAVAHQQTCMKIALTGTPVANSPTDAWAIFHFVSPEEWPAKGRFIDRYCLSGWNAWGGLDIIGLRPDRKDEFFKIIDPRFLRRPKALVLPQLPPKVYEDRFVEMTPKQSRAYKGIVKEMLAELESGLVAVTNPLVRALRLMQLSSSFALENDEGQWRLTEPSSKLDDFMELIEEIDGQAVVFAESRQLIEMLERRLTRAEQRFGRVTGATTTDERDRDIEAFQDGKLPLLLATLGAGGEGLTLTAGSTAVFLQRSWSMIKNAQAEDRLHRIGQEAQSVTIVNMIAAGTLEEHQLDALAGKADTLEELVRDEETLRRLLT